MQRRPKCRSGIRWRSRSFSSASPIRSSNTTPNRSRDCTDEGLHGYGPWLRRLWAEAKNRGADDTEAWAAIRDWARHRPAVWEAEDKRKKKGAAYSAPALGEHLARALTWTSSGDVFHTWVAEVDG